MHSQSVLLTQIIEGSRDRTVQHWMALARFPDLASCRLSFLLVLLVLVLAWSTLGTLVFPSPQK